MARSPQSNTEFASGCIAKMQDWVERVEIVSPYSFLAHSRQYPPARIGVVSSPAVTADAVRQVLASDPGVEFVVNIPKAAIWQGPAIHMLEETGVAFGPIGHLMKAISGRRNSETLNHFVHPETEYFRRILTQHTNLCRLVRVTDLIYEFQRKNGPPLLVAGLNEYELGGSTIRAAVAQHGKLSVIFATNPNAWPTSDAHEVAESMGIELFHERRKLYHRLHVPT